MPCQYFGFSVLVAHEDRLVPDPDHAVVGREHPVLEREWLAGLIGPSVLQLHLLAVVRVDPAEPIGGRVGEPLRGGHAEDLADPRVDVRDGELVAHRRLGVHDDGELLDERAVPRLRLTREGLALALARDVVHDALPEHGPVLVVVHEHRLVPEPHGAAVAPEHPVFGAERFAGRLRTTAFLLHAFQIVRDEPVGPCGGVGQPLARP